MISKNIITINVGIIEEVSNDLVSISKKAILNTTIWEFSSTEQNVLNEVIDEFMEKNYKYIISYNNMPLEKLVVNLLFKKNLTISFCESCSGGMLASTLVNVSGSSNVFNESYVTYSNESKTKILGVPKELIDEFGVQSLEVAKSMVIGLKNTTGSNVCISVTGFTKGNIETPVDGLCYFGIMVNNLIIVDEVQVTGDRNEIRENQKNYILNKLWEIIK